MPLAHATWMNTILQYEYIHVYIKLITVTWGPGSLVSYILKTWSQVSSNILLIPYPHHVPDELLLIEKLGRERIKGPHVYIRERHRSWGGAHRLVGRGKAWKCTTDLHCYYSFHMTIPYLKLCYHCSYCSQRRPAVTNKTIYYIWFRILLRHA